MGFAPYTNDRLPADECPVLGCFREKEFDHLFEFTDAVNSPFDGFNHVIFVGDNQRRFAKVLKTVAYVVCDVDGEPVVQKWKIKEHKEYDLTGVWAQWERERAAG
jgi:hypothetical protein